MKIRDLKSILVIASFMAFNTLIIVFSYKMVSDDPSTAKVGKAVAPEFTEIENLDYFHLREGVPQMSLAAVRMKSQGEELAVFEMPKGVYNHQAKNKAIRYSALQGLYKKQKDLLTLDGEVKIASSEADYSADRVKYYLKKDLITGKGNVVFEGLDPKSKDQVIIHSETMKARPYEKLSTFKGNVNGEMVRKKQYEGKITFSSATLDLDGNKSLAHLEGNVRIKRASYDLTAGNGDIFLENFNKSLKYFVMNDDVKVSEKIQTPEGVQSRQAFSERLEGFGREQKMVLSGAPRVEMGKDVIKGYRITIRENVDLIEVDDAMSDVQVKRKKTKE